MAVYDTNEKKMILDNEDINHTCQKFSILSVMRMRAYGSYVDYYPTIFNGDGKKWRSILIDDGHEVRFNL